jgi:glucokinase
VGYGKEGSFEGFCSGGGIAQLAAAKALERLQRGQTVSFCTSADQLPRLDARVVAEAALAGDPVALDVYRTSGRYLGRGLALLVDVLNPQIIVIGSVFRRAQDLLWPAAREVLEAEALPRSLRACTIVPDELGDALGDYAALAVALVEPEGS